MTVPDPAALDVARDFADFYLGDPSWGDLIVRAYLDPERAAADLAEDKGGRP